MNRIVRRAARPVGLPGIAPRALRSGYYSDAYFLNASRILAASARAGEGFTGRPLAVRAGVRGSVRFAPGDAEVEMQFFARRRPRFVAAGVDLAQGYLFGRPCEASALDLTRVGAAKSVDDAA